MKNKQIILGLLAVFTMLFNSEKAMAQRVKGNGHVVEITRLVKNFDGIYVSGGFDVELVPGKEGPVRISAEENLLPYLETVVEDGKLKLRWQKNTSISTRKGVKITVNVEKINKLVLTGSADITTKMALRSDMMSLKVTGSGDMDIELNVDRLEASVSGSGDMELKGTAQKIEAGVTGSGDLDALNLRTNEAKVRVSGSGSLKITVTDKLVARVSGSGDVFYKGNPEIEDINVSGSGEVSSY